MLQAGRSPVRVSDEMNVLNLPKSSSRTMAQGSTQTITEMSTRNFSGGKKRSARRADNLLPYMKNVGASTSRNAKGLHGLYRENFISLPGYVVQYSDI
jgi:hypothetical protein